MIGTSCQNNEVAAPFVGDTRSGLIIHQNLPNHPEGIVNLTEEETESSTHTNPHLVIWSINDLLEWQLPLPTQRISTSSRPGNR